MHRALERLSPPERVRAEQELTRRYAAIMPAWMASSVLSCLPVLWLTRGTPAFRTGALGTACFAAMLLSTRLGNVPINDRTLDPDKDQEEFARLREFWDRLHTLRVVLIVTGLASLLAGALGEDR